jgi:hypothetical protein
LGAAYIFERQGEGWQEVKKLRASDGATSDLFGWSVAISGDSVVIGTPQKAYDINGNGTLDCGYPKFIDCSVGASYIFERNHGGTNNWGEVKKILAHDPAFRDSFGSSVAIQGNTIVVGVPRKGHDLNKNGSIDCVFADGFGYTTGGDCLVGAAYVFGRDAGGANSWGEVQKLVSHTAKVNDIFGAAVAVSGERIAVGAPSNDLLMTMGDRMGATFVFEREPGKNTWLEVKKLTSSDVEPGDSIGVSVGVSGPFVGVGVRYDRNSNGDQAGGAYIYEQ